MEEWWSRKLEERLVVKYIYLFLYIYTPLQVPQTPIGVGGIAAPGPPGWYERAGNDTRCAPGAKSFGERVPPLPFEQAAQAAEDQGGKGQGRIHWTGGLVNLCQDSWQCHVTPIQPCDYPLH